MSSPLMTSCLLISWGLRPARTSRPTSCCQLGGSCSESVPWSSSLWTSAASSPSSLGQDGKSAFHLASKIPPLLILLDIHFQIDRCPHLLMAFGVPSWALQQILTVKSMLNINIFNVRKQRCKWACKCTCHFLCHPLAAGHGCEGQSARQGTPAHQEGPSEGRHSAWRGLRSESRLRNK